MKYSNPLMKKIKKSWPMMVSCNHCGHEIIRYQKKGHGTLLKLYIERVVESELVLGEKILQCPFCGAELGRLASFDGKNAYKMQRGHYTTKMIK